MPTRLSWREILSIPLKRAQKTRRERHSAGFDPSQGSRVDYFRWNEQYHALQMRREARSWHIATFAGYENIMRRFVRPTSSPVGPLIEGQIFEDQDLHDLQSEFAT